ncbi:hypothetical protein AYK26_04330 [Euryarchaeota archaeon SM23-78]|nr:MAG: hypothetical protein AYK26_04330 [Euryarchaeota archaeon SM23-78]MBW3000724.1 hypothetical protein [Candidatus Woesearchaeota archaeon]
MNACNGVTKPNRDEAVEITRLEPVIIEVEEEDKISSHLILFELICKVDFTPEEIIINGEVQETVFESEAKEY